MRIFCLLLYCILPFCESLYAQVYFSRVFEMPGDQEARSVRMLDPNSIYLAGFAENSSGKQDLALLKCDSVGNLIWMKTYPDTFELKILYMNRCGSDKLVLTGEAIHDSGNKDIFLMLLDSAGNKLWLKVYSSPLTESSRYVEETADGGFVLAGFQSDTSASNNIYILRTDSAGNKLWERNTGGTDNDYATMIREQSDGSFLVSADTRSRGAGSYDLEMLRLDASGVVTEDSVIGTTRTEGCQGFLQLPAGQILIFGEGEPAPGSPFDFYLVLLDSDFQVLWQNWIGGTGSDALFSAAADTGGFVFTGYSASYSQGSLDIVVLKTDTAGELLWIESYGGRSADLGYEIIASYEGGFLIAATSTDVDNDMHLLHVSSTGGLLIPEVSETTFSAYPNPFRDLIHFEEDGRVEIISADGRTVYLGNTADCEIETDWLKNGFYVVRFTKGRKSSFFKMIKM